MKVCRGIVSGYFNPLHYGHIEYMHWAKLHSDHLTVIVNNDEQVELKGSYPFMDEQHRMLIIQNLKDVDNVILAVDKDKTVCQTIRLIREKYPEDNMTFFNSGDRKGDNLETAEVSLCKELLINYVVLDLPKRYSSSVLIRKASLEV